MDKNKNLFLSDVIEHGGKNHVVSVNPHKDFVELRHYTVEKDSTSLMMSGVVSLFLHLIMFTTLISIVMLIFSIIKISFLFIILVILFLPLLYVDDLLDKKVNRIKVDSIRMNRGYSEEYCKDKRWKVLDEWIFADKEELALKEWVIISEESIVVSKMPKVVDEFAKMVILGLKGSNATDIIEALEMLENPTIRRDSTMYEKLLETMKNVGEAEKMRIFDSAYRNVEEINNKMDFINMVNVYPHEMD